MHADPSQLEGTCQVDTGATGRLCGPYDFGHVKLVPFGRKLVQGKRLDLDNYVEWVFVETINFVILTKQWSFFVYDD